MVRRMQDVLYRHTLLDHIYIDFVDAPGGQGNWGYEALDAASEIPDPLKVTQSVERSVAMVEAKLQEAYEEGYPFHAVLAYSQGASLAALVASRVCHLESCKDLKWILMAGDASFLWELGVQSPIPVASLHIAGRNDWTVPFHESETLSRFFVEPRFFEHSGGHEFLPADTFLQVVDFLDLAVECCWCGRNSEGIEGIRFHMFSRRAFCNTCWVAYGGPWGYWPNA